MGDPMNVLCKHYAGSIAYGTNLPTSDTDFRGIYVDPPVDIVTPWSVKRTEQWTDKSEEDTVLTELYKYMTGYMDGSPNVLETLWVNEGHVTQTSSAYEYLRSMRGDLLSRKLRYTFGGYALGQMKRIKGHNKWINNPQSEDRPVREDYFKLIQNFKAEQIFSSGFEIRDYCVDHILIPYGNDIYGVVEHSGGRLFNFDGSIREVKYEELPDSVKKSSPEFIVKLKEDVFKSDLETHRNYWTWRKERNESRSALEEKFGYDTKHAMHIVRLLRMGEEVLTDGIVQVHRPDAKELLAIRDGEWSYEELLEWSEHQDNLLDTLVKTSPLPPKPDLELAKKVLKETERLAQTCYK